MKKNVQLRVDENLDRYMTSVDRYVVMSREQELECARRMKAGDTSARAQLINANLRFVVKCAHEYNGYGFRLLDIIQEGNVGLVIAADKFDPERGWRFISMAVWWIKAYIQNYLLRYWSVVRTGTTQRSRKLFYKLKGTQGEVRKLGLPPDEEAKEVARRLNVPEQDVREMDVRMSRRDWSLNSLISEDEDHATTHQDVLVDEGEAIDVIMETVQRDDAVRAMVDRALATLTEQERYIVVRRCMISEPKTLREIGEDYGFSRERARQIEARAVKKIRRVLEAA